MNLLTKWTEKDTTSYLLLVFLTNNLNSDDEKITNKSKLNNVLIINRCLFSKIAKIKKDFLMGKEWFQIKETKEIWQLNERVIWDWIPGQENNCQGQLLGKWWNLNTDHGLNYSIIIDVKLCDFDHCTMVMSETVISLRKDAPRHLGGKKYVLFPMYWKWFLTEGEDKKEGQMGQM